MLHSTDAEIRDILTDVQTIAVVGWSPNPDRPSHGVARFLAQTPVSFPVALAGLEGANLTRELGNTAGGLPFSLLFDASGQLRERKLGQLREGDLLAWRKAVGSA